MEAIILAGGLGTRLRQVVPSVPKPMAPVAGRPFLEILLGTLERKGFSRAVLSLGFMAENIYGYFGRRYAGMDLDYVVEARPLGTGGAIRLAATACKQDHMSIFNGDTYLDLQVDHLEQQWQAKRNPIVVGVIVPDTSRYGRLMIENGQIVAFAEKGASGPGLINAGCYVLPRDALSNFPLNHSFSIEKDYLMPEVARADVEVFVAQGMFIDIGIPEDYALAQTLLAKR